MISAFMKLYQFIVEAGMKFLGLILFGLIIVITSINIPFSIFKWVNIVIIIVCLIFWFIIFFSIPKQPK